MSADSEFLERNARFLDLMIRKWELLIEYQGRLKHRDKPVDQAVLDDTNQTSLQVEALESEARHLREEVGKSGGRFPFDQVVETYGLGTNEERILELALIPRLDTSFRDKISRYRKNLLLRQVDVDLAVGMLFVDRADRLIARSYFGEAAPLMANQLLSLVTPADAVGEGLLSQELRPSERLVDFVLCRQTLDASLRAYATLSHPTGGLERVALPEGEAESLQQLVSAMGTEPGHVGSAPPFPVGKGVTLELCGPAGTGKTTLALALAHSLGRPVIEADAVSLSAAKDSTALLQALFSEARVQGAVLVLDRAEPLLAPEKACAPVTMRLLSEFGGLAILTTSKVDAMDGSVERHVAWKLDLGMPEVEERRRIWELLKPEGLALAKDVDLEDLAARFEVTGGQIRSAWAVAARRAGARAGSKGKGKGKATVSQAQLKDAATGQIRANMSDYTIRSKVGLTLDDLVLPAPEKVLVNEVLQACHNRIFVMSKWGFAKRLTTGKGICVLFKGEPGTGKTLCAEILAGELGIKLYQISIPKIVSKYVGETEKNISKVFSSARANHSMLLFDEADSLFTKRVNVENAIDRFSNMETNLLLQEIERFEGVTILTTNLDKNIDDAFARRIQFKIDFPFPDPEHRTLIWKTLFPKECPVDADIDFEDLGRWFELSGGHIKNAVLRAAYRAASRSASASITKEDIEFAAEQECKNAGKLFRTSGSQSRGEL